MSKLWSKGYELDSLVEEFTVGSDFILDIRLIPADVIGSLAHATMLHSVGLLGDDDLASLRDSLLTILGENERGEFTISPSDEDGHTAIENRLVELSGDAGKRIHLGRSRNDQVLTTTRLWMRSFLFRIIKSCGRLTADLLEFAEAHQEVPLPGRTHMQPAMPSSVGLWAGGYAEMFLDDLFGLSSLFSYLDQSPLGSGAGYGTPLPLDREMTAKLMGFGRLQNNVAYGGLSRGKFESRLVDALDQTAISLSKLAAELILFSLPEFGWFTLPQELCTGSSIMPQKRNPDGLELMRAKAASVGARSQEIKAIIRSLPSGYNRDYQDTKEPMLRAADTVMTMCEVGGLTVRKLEVNEGRILQAFDPGIFATDAAINLVAGGMSFRDAYREVGTNPEKYPAGDPKAAIADRTAAGTAGNLRLETARKALADALEENRRREEAVNGALEQLAGRPVTLV